MLRARALLASSQFLVSVEYEEHFVQIFICDVSLYWIQKLFLFLTFKYLIIDYRLSLTYVNLFVDQQGCSYCGGLAHRITDCPKLEALQNKQATNIGRKDYLASNSADW